MKSELRIPWYERAFVSFADAGEIVGRTYSWVRDRTIDGTFEAWRLPSGGPAVISVASLRRFISSAEPTEPTEPIAMPLERSYLRLIVNNDRTPL